jgi:D-3-phosphoglycerate dehydrogenase
VRNAVNLPALDAEQFKELEPFLILSEKLGQFIAQLAEGPFKELKIEYAGEISLKNTTPLTLAILKGFLTPMLGSEVNVVNAPHLAKERDLKWTETKSNQTADYTSLITLKVASKSEKMSVAGTLLAKNNPRIVAIDGLSVDVVPEGAMVIYTNADKPGVIGYVGTVLGKNNINIAGMQVGRKGKTGEAVTVVNVDTDVPEAVLAQIKEFQGITQVKNVKL